MFTKLKSNKGFTIIELLIVIAVIGILALLVLTTFRNAQAKGRDAHAKADIDSLVKHLEFYYEENGSYPADEAAVNTTNLDGLDPESLIDPDGDAWASTDSDYGYSVTSGTYTLTADLEQEADISKTGLN